MRWLVENLPPWRWLAALAPLVAAFIVAPLVYGGTYPEVEAVIDRLLFHGFLVWLCVLVLERRWPRIPVGLLVPLLLLGLISLAYLVNPRSFLNAGFPDFTDLDDYLRWLPSSVDSATCLTALVHLSAMLLGGLVLRDGMASSRVRWLLFRVVALSGLVIAVVGIYQKAIDTDVMLWNKPLPPDSTFFAAFRYHGNAASFLNLSWPAALAVWLRSRWVRPGSLGVSLDLCVFFIVLAAVFANTSKAGQVVGLIGVFWAAWRFRSELLVPATSRIGGVIVALFVVGLAAVFILPGLYSSIGNWSKLLDGGESAKGRFLAYQACLGAVREGGWFGFGAGTFRYIFPFYTNEFEDRIVGTWQYAHQDWLQGLMEWGWAGFAIWAAIFIGAFTRLMRRSREGRRRDEPEIGASVAIIALGMVLIHSLVDFPLQIPALQWLVVFYLAFAWSSPRGGGGRDPIETDKPAV